MNQKLYSMQIRDLRAISARNAGGDWYTHTTGSYRHAKLRLLQWLRDDIQRRANHEWRYRVIENTGIG